MAEQIITKRCSKCKQIKPLSEFHKNKAAKKDGLTCACKQCKSEKHRYWYKHKGGREYKRQYGQTEKYKICNRRCQQNWHNSERGKQIRIEYGRKYRSTTNGKQAHKKANNKWYKNKGKQCYRRKYKENPNQFKAYKAIQVAIKNGNILSPKLLKCTYCNKQAELYHHASYEPKQWLIVIPVCKLCHSSIHRKLSLSG